MEAALTISTTCFKPKIHQIYHLINHPDGMPLLTFEDLCYFDRLLAVEYITNNTNTFHHEELYSFLIELVRLPLTGNNFKSGFHKYEPSYIFDLYNILVVTHKKSDVVKHIKNSDAVALKEFLYSKGLLNKVTLAEIEQTIVDDDTNKFKDIFKDYEGLPGDIFLLLVNYDALEFLKIFRSSSSENLSLRSVAVWAIKKKAKKCTDYYTRKLFASLQFSKKENVILWCIKNDLISLIPYIPLGMVSKRNLAPAFMYTYNQDIVRRTDADKYCELFIAVGELSKKLN
jgi:hypothetical protein